MKSVNAYTMTGACLRGLEEHLDVIKIFVMMMAKESVLMTMVTQLRCAIKENGDQCAMIIGLIMMQKWLVNNLDFPNLTLVPKQLNEEYLKGNSTRTLISLDFTGSMMSSAQEMRNLCLNVNIERKLEPITVAEKKEQE
jgi:hypothetical protein